MYRGSAGSSRSNGSRRTRLSLISRGSSRSRKSDWSSHTTGTILASSTISTLDSLVTLDKWTEKKSEAYCTKGKSDPVGGARGGGDWLNTILRIGNV